MVADVPFEPELLVAKLNAARVRYVVVGGLACGAHGVVRATRDLDLVPAPDESNLDLLAAELSTLGARHPIEDALTGALLGRPVSMGVETRHGAVHVLNRMPGTPDYPELERDRILVQIDFGVDAPVCSLEHLRRMKRASSRPRDAVDLAELDEVHGPG